jgi:Flp pilus assembly pilin Flp
MRLKNREAITWLAAWWQSIAGTSRSSMRGQGLAEYALILALIAIVAIVALLFLGGQVSKILSTVGKSV